MSKTQFKSHSTIREFCVTGSGAIRAGYDGACRYVYEAQSLIQEERDRTAQRAALARGTFGPSAQPARIRSQSSYNLAVLLGVD